MNQQAFTISKVGSALLVSVPEDLDLQSYRSLQHALLKQVQEMNLRAVVLDLTAVDVLDETDIRTLIGMVRACRLMGAQTRVVGLRASLCAILVDFPESDELETRFGVEEALREFPGNTE